jgi:hypothetical protein
MRETEMCVCVCLTDSLCWFEGMAWQLPSTVDRQVLSDLQLVDRHSHNTWTKWDERLHAFEVWLCVSAVYLAVCVCCVCAGIQRR